MVTGIPKSEGMDPPPKIPANPSFVELDEDENAVEKFKTAMTSVTSILHLDKLKQVRGPAVTSPCRHAVDRHDICCMQ